METEEIFAAIQKAAETIAAPNWTDKVSVVISIISALISLIAVIVAGYVAWKQYGITKKQNEISQKQTEMAEKQTDIAAQQNRIALFEKRYELYQLAKSCMRVAGFLESFRYHNLEEFYKYIFFRFDEIVMENQNIGIDRIIYAMRDIADKLQQSEFLFSSKVSNPVWLLAECFRSFAFLENTNQVSEEFQKVKEQYCQVASLLKSKQILAEMKSELQPILTR